jgi:hypothetical protein
MRYFFLFVFVTLAIRVGCGEPSTSFPNLALQCLVSCSDGTKAEAAVDGNRDGRLFWETPLKPGTFPWLELDLGEIKMIRRLHLFMWWGKDGRYYQYFIEVSSDRKQWRRVVDQRDNTIPTDENGREFQISPQQVRFIRLTLAYCSVNDSGHVRELEVY